MTTLEQDLETGLLETGTPPCLSLYQPTSRHHPENLQDPIRFANLVKSMEHSLAQQYPRDQASELLAPFRALAVDHDFWRHTFEGLAVLGARDRFRVYRLQRPVPPLAIVADSFHVKPLLRIHQSADRFQILGLSRTSVCLYEGNRDALGAIALAEGVPETPDEVPGGARRDAHLTVASYGSVPQGMIGSGGAHSAMHHGHGGRSEATDLETERFFRAVDRAVLQHHTQPSGLPLILAALPEHHQLFRSISRNPHLLPMGIDVHPSALDSLDALRERAWLLLQPQYDARLEALAEAFGTARAHKMGDDVLPQVARAAVAGRIKTLLIEEERYLPGRLDMDTGHIENGGDLHDAHTDDLLDDLGELVASMGGTVVVVPGARMPTSTGVAAIYRFGPTRPPATSKPEVSKPQVSKPEESTPEAVSPKPTSAPSRPGEHHAVLEQHTVAELYEMARDRNIRGRSTMRKAELIAALRPAQ